MASAHNVFQVFKQTANQFPNNIAIVDEFGSLTYSELLVEIELLITKLKERGMGKGMTVGVLTHNNRNFLIGLYAAVACDALVMPIFHQQKSFEIESAITDGQLHIMIAEVKLAEEKLNLPCDRLNENLVITRTARPSNQLVADFIENPAFMRFTSGTTGMAKGVVLSHQSVLERIEAANEVLKISAADTIMWVLPMAYHFVVSIVLYLSKGATIVVNEGFLAEQLIESMHKYKATFFYGSPTHIKLLAAYPKEASLNSLRMVISTTTAISARVCEAFENKYHKAVTQAFGIIEVGLPVVNTAGAHEHPDAIGHALPAYQVEILSDQYEPVDKGGIGLLGIKGPGMFDGYLTPETPREQVLQNGWFITGDLAEKDANGLITIKGRKKEVINVHGNKVFPTEVEEVINQFEGIERSKVYGKKHALLGEIVAADVVATAKIDKEALISFCRKRLTSFKLPQVIHVVDKIEMTGSGKVKRW